MDLEELMGRYFRLKQELAIAYRAQPWQTARLDRLAEDLAATEKEIVAARSVDEQCGETSFGFLLLRDFAM